MNHSPRLPELTVQICQPRTASQSWNTDDWCWVDWVGVGLATFMVLVLLVVLRQNRLGHDVTAAPAMNKAGDASNLPSVKELRSLASRLQSQANISTRPGQLEELEWISARLLVWANTMERRKDNAMRGAL